MSQRYYKPIEKNCHPNELPDGGYMVPGCKFSVKNGIIGYVYLLSDDLDNGVKFIQEENVSCVCLNTYYGYELQDTDCLSLLPNVTEVLIHGSWMDKSGLHSMKALRKLNVGMLGDDWNSDVDLSNFPNLHFFSGCYCQELVIPPELSQMEKMRLWKYPNKDMMLFPIAPKLASLELIQAKLKSLEGMERLKSSLRYLSIGNCRSLMDLSMIKELELSALELTSIPNIEQLQDILPKCSSLLGVSLNCGSKALPSIGFLNKMPKLKCFAGILKDIADGDLTPTVRLDNVFIPFIKKHYNLQKISNNNASWSGWLEKEGMYHWWPPAH